MSSRLLRRVLRLDSSDSIDCIDPSLHCICWQIRTWRTDSSDQKISGTRCNPVICNLICLFHTLSHQGSTRHCLQNHNIWNSRHTQIHRSHTVCLDASCPSHYSQLLSIGLTGRSSHLQFPICQLGNKMPQVRCHRNTFQCNHKSFCRPSRPWYRMTSQMHQTWFVWIHIYFLCFVHM